MALSDPTVRAEIKASLLANSTVRAVGATAATQAVEDRFRMFEYSQEAKRSTLTRRVSGARPLSVGNSTARSSFLSPLPMVMQEREQFDVLRGVVLHEADEQGPQGHVAIWLKLLSKVTKFFFVLSFRGQETLCRFHEFG